MYKSADFSECVLRTGGTDSQNVRCIVPVDRNGSRALTFENVCYALEAQILKTYAL